LSYKKPVLIIPNLTAPELFESNYKPPFKNGYYTIGYVGTPTKKDGIEDLLSGFSIFNNKYPDSHLLIIGDITSGKSIISNLKTFARELGILKNITFTGLVPYKKIPGLLNSCNALVLARPKGIFAEAGFPTKLGEYFACKKPVVITKVGDIPKYFEDKKHAVLVNPNDPNDVSKGFEFLINNESKSKKIALNGYEWMMENLYYKKIAFKISDFIRSVYETK
jgi:glycosyltransferase involved in cell wall biosynthesis